MADPKSRTGERYAGPEILAWVDRVHAPHDAALARAWEAPERHGMPAIQIAPSEGKLLEIVLRLGGARRVVEVGTLAGYSALWIARAIGPDGRLWTVEKDSGHARVARETVEAAALGDRVTVVEGDARAVLGSLEAHGPFDAVFLDADKASYPAYGRWAARHVRPGGLLVADNAYLFGRLLDDGAEAAAVRRFHEEAARAFDTTCVPTPDGMLVGVRKGA